MRPLLYRYLIRTPIVNLYDSAILLQQTEKLLPNTPFRIMSLQTRSCKRLGECLFTREALGSNVCVCQCVTKLKLSGSSYQNLLWDERATHPNYLDSFGGNSEYSQAELDYFFTIEKSSNLYGWIDFIINGLLLFHIVEKNFIKRHIKHNAPSLDSFLK